MDRNGSGWVALLRAVNVGGHNRVPMSELRLLLSELGFGAVSTYIASGNAVFTAPRMAREALAGSIESAIAETFGVGTTVVLRTPPELARVVAAHPFGDDTSRSFVTFLTAKPTAAATQALAALDVAPEELHLAGHDLYVRYPNGAGRTRLTGAVIERQLGAQGTARNWRTVTTLAGLAAEL